MVANSIHIRNSAGWLRGVAFDGTYIVGFLALALMSGWLVVSNPRLFTAIFVLNGWLLGYHHVISTYTRLAFDRQSFTDHRFLIIWLPLIVLACVILACFTLGVWVLTSAYLYWQWWHYTRQSYGVSRIYARRAGLPVKDRWMSLTIYAVPFWGVLYRSYQSPQEYLFSQVKVVPVPFWLVTVAGALSLIVVARWLSQQLKAWFEGRLPIAHSLYVASHLTVFTVGYILISDINHGWLVLNIWHNCQYILTVWMFNNNRFKNEIHPRHRFLSYLSRRSNVAPYFAICLAISTLVYALLAAALSLPSPIAAATSLPLFAIAYQTINFHHYLVDAVIWKVRKKVLRQNLGLST